MIKQANFSAILLHKKIEPKQKKSYILRMIEIELKARVHDLEKTIQKLNSFAKFSGQLERHDTYWSIFTSENPAKKITARIRREIKDGKQKVFLTYKRKKLVENISDGQAFQTEVNEENESELSDEKAVEFLLRDSGFKISSTKEKYVSAWIYDTKYGQALLELCRIPPLGNFLEIEILCEPKKQDNSETAGIQNELLNILEKSGISKEQIENRFYSDLLKEIQCKQQTATPPSTKKRKH